MVNESGCPDSIRDMSGSGPLGPILSGVWQSLQPPTVTRYLPRSTRACCVWAAVVRVSATVPRPATTMPAVMIPKTTFLVMMALLAVGALVEYPQRLLTSNATRSGKPRNRGMDDLRANLAIRRAPHVGRALTAIRGGEARAGASSFPTAAG